MLGIGGKFYFKILQIVQVKIGDRIDGILKREVGEVEVSEAANNILSLGLVEFLLAVRIVLAVEHEVPGEVVDMHASLQIRVSNAG